MFVAQCLVFADLLGFIPRSHRMTIFSLIAFAILC